MQGVRALIVDDFKAWRDFVRDTLEKMPGLLIVGEASDGSEAVKKGKELQPDLMVLDIALPLLNGFEVAQEIGRTCQRCKIIFLSEDHFADAAQEVLQAGVRAYVRKMSAGTELLPAIHTTLNGMGHELSLS